MSLILDKRIEPNRRRMHGKLALSLLWDNKQNFVAATKNFTLLSAAKVLLPLMFQTSFT